MKFGEGRRRPAPQRTPATYAFGHIAFFDDRAVRQPHQGWTIIDRHVRVDPVVTRTARAHALTKAAQRLDCSLLAGAFEDVVGATLLEDAPFTYPGWRDPLIEQDRPDDCVLHLRKTATEKVCS